VPTPAKVGAAASSPQQLLTSSGSCPDRTHRDGVVPAHAQFRRRRREARIGIRGARTARHSPLPVGGHRNRRLLVESAASGGDVARRASRRAVSSNTATIRILSLRIACAALSFPIASCGWIEPCSSSHVTPRSRPIVLLSRIIRGCRRHFPLSTRIFKARCRCFGRVIWLSSSFGSAPRSRSSRVSARDAIRRADRARSHSASAGGCSRTPGVRTGSSVEQRRRRPTNRSIARASRRRYSRNRGGSGHPRRGPPSRLRSRVISRNRVPRIVAENRAVW